MVKVVICDDEKEICAKLESSLISIFAEMKMKCDISVFYAGQELCRKIEAGASYELFFLDIEFANSEINGVETGKLIRDSHKTVSIVYISWEKSYAMQLFDIRPLNFLLKPLAYEKIKQVAETYVKLSGFSAGEFVYKKGHGMFKIPIKDIMYLESQGRKIIIHMENGEQEEFYGSLKSVYNEQLVSFDFLFIHSAFVVNYDYVAETKYSQLYICGKQDFLPIGQSRRNEIRERYLSIMKGRSG
jgi:DNA-binding LytR/AlgR family response regulator